MTPETRARLEAWRQASKDLDAQGDTLICAARAEGGSLREIADLVGLSHTEVRRILKENQK